MKNFNRKIFVRWAFITGILTIPSLLAAWGRDEGTLGSNYFLNAFANLFNVIRFPVHTLFMRFIGDKYLAIFFFGGLFIDCLFYGLIIERLTSFTRKFVNSINGKSN